MYQCNYAKHRLMNAYGRLFGTKVLSLLYIKHERVIYIVVEQNFKLREVLMNLYLL